MQRSIFVAPYIKQVSAKIQIQIKNYLSEFVEAKKILITKESMHFEDKKSFQLKASLYIKEIHESSKYLILFLESLIFFFQNKSQFDKIDKHLEELYEYSKNKAEFRSKKYTHIMYYNLMLSKQENPINLVQLTKNKQTIEEKCLFNLKKEIIKYKFSKNFRKLSIENSLLILKYKKCIMIFKILQSVEIQFKFLKVEQDEKITLHILKSNPTLIKQPYDFMFIEFLYNQYFYNQLLFKQLVPYIEENTQKYGQLSLSEHSVEFFIKNEILNELFENEKKQFIVEFEILHLNEEQFNLKKGFLSSKKIFFSLIFQSKNRFNEEKIHLNGSKKSITELNGQQLLFKALLNAYAVGKRKNSCVCVELPFEEKFEFGFLNFFKQTLKEDEDKFVLEFRLLLKIHTSLKEILICDEFGNFKLVSEFENGVFSNLMHLFYIETVIKTQLEYFEFEKSIKDENMYLIFNKFTEKKLECSIETIYCKEKEEIFVKIGVKIDNIEQKFDLFQIIKSFKYKESKEVDYDLFESIIHNFFFFEKRLISEDFNAHKVALANSLQISFNELNIEY